MRNGSIVYFCKRTSAPSDDIETFAKPVAYRLGLQYLTIQPTGGRFDEEKFGEFVDITNRGIATPYVRWDGVFHEGDRFYLESVPDGYESGEEPEDGWGYDADAKIKVVRKQNEAIMLIIQNIVRS